MSNTPSLLGVPVLRGYGYCQTNRLCAWVASRHSAALGLLLQTRA